MPVLQESPCYQLRLLLQRGGLPTTHCQKFMSSVTAQLESLVSAFLQIEEKQSYTTVIKFTDEIICVVRKCSTHLIHAQKAI